MKKLNVLMGGLALAALIPLSVTAAPFKPVVEPISAQDQVKANPVYKIGSEYSLKGVSYTPNANNSYDEVGIASWYGDQFNGKLTSNGEIFNKDLATAASATLPLPSIVEVTNLDNGKKLIVRVNDRGPYTSSNRLIDLSERSATLLGFKEQGTARVRVTILPDLSKIAAEQMPNYQQVSAGNSPNNPVAPRLASNEAVTGNTAAPMVTPVSNTSVVPNSQLSDVQSTPVSATSDDTANKPVQVNENNLKQVNLEEPNSIQQYVPRGVFVQVGAFDSGNANIKEAITSLSKVGVVTLQNIDLQGKNILRVRVGPYGSIDDAGKVKSALVKLGYKDPRIVVEE